MKSPYSIWKFSTNFFIKDHVKSIYAIAVDVVLSIDDFLHMECNII
jgi:hypothetical protein